jgi:GNAT superfamily N-acetyltransferase
MIMLQIVPLKEEHIEDAARLVGDRYQQLCLQVPDLPQRYSNIGNLLPLLLNILKATGNGVAAIRNRRLVGFLTGWQMLTFRGQRSIYSPEWANAADMEDSAHIYQEMYTHLSSTWLAEKYLAHYISLFPNDIHGLQAWNWLGFGMFAIDALRSVEPIRVDNVDAIIRRADIQDIEQVIALHDDLWSYIKGPPVFLLNEKRDRHYFQEWLQAPDKVVWLACTKDEPVAFMRLGPADDDVCTIIVDEKTTSIYSAFTKEKVRRGGIASALLAHALDFARLSGYQRCAVPFEPMNPLGTRFWLEYFKPVCFSILRIVDDRLI